MQTSDISGLGVEEAAATDPAEGEANDHAVQFVAFAVGAQNFCVDIMQVREIRAWSGATALPNAPKFVRGVECQAFGRATPAQLIGRKLLHGTHGKRSLPNHCVSGRLLPTSLFNNHAMVTAPGTLTWVKESQAVASASDGSKNCLSGPRRA